MRWGDNGASSASVSILSDSDWAMGSVHRISYSGNVIHVNGDLVAWYTQNQSVVAASSTEAEYIAVLDACKDGLNMFHFMNEFVQVNIPIHTFMDNQGAMYMASNQVTNKRYGAY